MTKQIKQYISNFFEKHTLVGFLGFLLTINGFSVTLVYFIVDYFFPKERLILELIYFAFWLNFFLATYLILFSFYQKEKKKIFSLLALFLVFIPLVFFNFFDYIEIIIFWAKGIATVSIFILISNLYIKFHNHPFMKILYSTLGIGFIYLGFKFQIFQGLYHALISFGKIILLFFALIFSLLFNIEPTSTQRFKEFFAQPIPKEVREIRFSDESVIMLWGYSLYYLDFKADKKFLNDLALQTKFPKEDSRNKAIHKIKCNVPIFSEETCYKGVIYPYVHNITYNEKNKDFHDSISYYGELATW